MKSPTIYFAIAAVALVLLTSYVVHRKSLLEQIEELNSRSRAEKLFAEPTKELTAFNGETLVRSLDPTPQFELVDRLTLKLHAAAAREFFTIAGIEVAQMNLEYYYEMNSTSVDWVTLIGETGDGKNATLIVAARVDSTESLIKLIEKRWKIPKDQWKNVRSIKVRDCSKCETYHLKYQNEDYVLILGKSEASDLVHAVAELSEKSKIQAHAQQLADRLSFKMSNGF